MQKTKIGRKYYYSCWYFRIKAKVGEITKSCLFLFQKNQQILSLQNEWYKYQTVLQN
jgi:hypothetical protein